MKNNLLRCQICCGEVTITYENNGFTPPDPTMVEESYHCLRCGHISGNQVMTEKEYDEIMNEMECWQAEVHLKNCEKCKSKITNQSLT